MAREHADVLQNVEFALVTSYREDETFDDAAALAALPSVGLGETQADDPRVDRALQLLHSVRATRQDVTDKFGQDGLRVEMDSVRRRSRLLEGEESYLAFVNNYLP